MTATSTPIDVAVIGAGIVGLAMADALLADGRGLRVVVLDKEPVVARHASGRNSGVLHAGFYYSPDSLKARLTRRGNVLLSEFIEGAQLPLRTCGKVVVATSEAQLPELERLAERGAANGVPLEMVSEDRLHELEPLARTVGSALFSPTTSVADPVAVTNVLAQRVVARGGELALGEPAVAAGPGWVRTDRRVLTVTHTVNAAGLHADRVAKWFGVGQEYRMMPFKGLYWYGGAGAPALQRHVYPVPDPRQPFLGVHLTVTASGGVKIGPTAIPALWREDYGDLRSARPRETAAIASLYPGFLSSPGTGGLLRDELPSYSRRVIAARARELVPSVRAADFTTRGRPGVRAQLWNVDEQRLEQDFVVRSGAGSTHVLNAVSPAWTSALAVAEHLTPQILSDLR